MPSWRDAASDLAQSDLDGLLDQSLGLAEQHLNTRHEFYPFATAVRVDGRVEVIAADPARVGDRPESATVIDECRRALRERRREFRAAALVTDVSLENQTGDAVQVDLEHQEGTSLTVSLPYSVVGSDVEFGQLRASTSTGSIWSI